MSDPRFTPVRQTQRCLAAGLLLAGLVVIGSANGANGADRSVAIAVDIRVRVLDAELQPLPGAVVEVLDDVSNPAEPTHIAHAAVDEQGRAQFEELPPGRYTVRASLTGFLDTEVGPLPLTAKDLRSTMMPELMLVLNTVTVD